MIKIILILQNLNNNYFKQYHVIKFPIIKLVIKSKKMSNIKK
jgi:hypothetical protein